MRMSENGKRILKNFEGLKLCAYRCTSGIWTIGYGHTGITVKSGDIITEAAANEFFEQDIKFFENAVNTLVTVKLNQNQFDALISFCFNIGVGKDGFAGSTMRKLLNRGEYTAAAEQFMRWVYSGGKISEGLRRRRIKERELFLS